MSNTNAEVAALLANTFKGKDDIIIATQDLKADLRDAVSTGIVGLDARIGGGLFPGRIYELFGEESHGKSTLAHSIAGHWQRKTPKHIVHIVETESALDKTRAQAIGMDLNRLIVTESDLVTEGFQKIREVDEMVHKNIPGAKVLHIWDTIAAAATESEKRGEQYGGGIADKARTIRSALRDVNARLSKSGSILIVVNQVYDMIGSFGGGVTSPGGRGLRHHTSARIHVIKKQPIVNKIEGQDKIVGYNVELKFIKNKVAVPMTHFVAKMSTELGFLPTASLTHDVIETLKPSDINFGGGGWTTIPFPKELADTCPPGRGQFKGQGLGAVEKGVKKSRFLRDYFTYLTYKRYCDFFPLMAMKYRELIWEKQIAYVESWNAECANYGGKPVDPSVYPKPPELTQEEIQALNTELAELDSSLDSSAVEPEEKDPMAID